MQQRLVQEWPVQQVCPLLPEVCWASGGEERAHDPEVRVQLGTPPADPLESHPHLQPAFQEVEKEKASGNE
mgnify:CR=1 FL=1